MISIHHRGQYDTTIDRQYQSCRNEHSANPARSHGQFWRYPAPVVYRGDQEIMEAPEPKHTPPEAAPPRPLVPRPVALAISVTLTALALFLLSRFVDLTAIPAQLATTQWHWVAIIAAGGITLGLFGLCHKWWLVLRARGVRIRYRDVLFLRVGTSPVSVLMPFKTGEALPVLYLYRRHRIPISTAAGTILFDKATSVMALLLLGLVGGLRSEVLPVWIPALGALAGLAALIPGVADFCVRLVRLDRTRLAEPIAELLGCFRELSLRARVGLVLYAVAIQCGMSVLLTLSLYSQSVEPPMDQALFLAAVAILVANLPLTVAGLGTREAMFLLLFGQWGTPEQLVGASALFMLLEVALPILGGAFLLQPLLHRLVLGQAPPQRPATETENKT